MIQTRHLPFLVVSLVFVALQQTDSQPSVRQFPSEPKRRGMASADEQALPNLAEFSSTGTDTFVIANYTFEGPNGKPAWQGWESVDRTALGTGVYWHVSGVDVPLGGRSKAMWCGVDSTAEFPCAPGYGNNWWQLFSMSEAIPVQGNVTISCLASWDTEPDYDYFHLEYMRDGSWRQLASFDGTEQGRLLVYTVPAANHNGTIRFRFRFSSDPIYSDEDCAYDSHGAARVDNIVIADAARILNLEDFEDEPDGATQTNDGFWIAEDGRPRFGDYARLVDTYDVFVDCAERRTHAVGFLKNGARQWCQYQLPETVPLVPHGDPWARPINVISNEARSPAVSLLVDEHGTLVDPSATRTILEFSVYRDLDSWNHGMVYTYRVRGFQGEVPTGEAGWWSPGYWLDGTARDWYRWRVDITDIIGSENDHVQVALGVQDISPDCVSYECGGCSSVSPLFDNVRILRVIPGGIRWGAARRDVFQDDFPPGGSTTGHVRMDAAGTNEIYWTARDSSVVTVVDDGYGLGIEPSTGTPAVYLHVRSSGGQIGASVLGDETQYASNDGEWTTGVCAPVGTNKFACDLADDLFVPGDSITFYFSAVNALGARSYFSVRGGATDDEAVARASADEAECLPSGRSDILYIDAAPATRAERFFEDAFRQLGLNPDRIDYPLHYDDENVFVDLFPPRARLSQLKSAYRTIVLSTGDRRFFGTDLRFISGFLDSTSAWDPGLYLTGGGTGHLYAVQLTSRIGVDWLGAVDHFVYPLSVSPGVAAVPGGIFDHADEVPPRTPDQLLVTNRDCVTLDGFDVLSPWGTGVVAMTYGANPAYPATVTNVRANLVGRTMRTVTDGFEFERIRDVVVNGRAAYLDHLEDVLEFLRGEDLTPTRVGDASVAKNWLRQNVPNPFNPSTRIWYAIAKSGRVRIDIFDVRGSRVRTLVDATQRPQPGGYSVTWDGTDSRGLRVASGVYFYRLVAPEYSATRKMVVLK